MPPRLFLSRTGSPRGSDSGFALLITITLVAFLVLILVSLASFTRIETQVASNSQQVSQARQNALMALNIAVGQLQKAAGPDQRATAPADLLNPSAPAAAVTPNGLARWTGAWGNTTAPGDYAQLTPVVLNWLVSGNENTSFGADVSAATFGRIDSTSTPAFLPTQGVANLTVGSRATDTNLRINGSPARLLVGSGTLGTDAANLDKFVVAPLANISVPASLVPGLSGDSPTIIGRYAYWIGDEGVKAKVNQIDPYATGTATTDQRRYRYLAPQRTGVELIDDDNVTPGASNLTAIYPVNAASLAGLLQADQLPLLGASPAQQATLQDARRNRFHDITTFSRGVLADQSRGGLRRDLTAAFADNSPTSAVNAFLASPIYPASASGLPEGPPWAFLRDYYRLNPSGGAAVDPRAATATGPGIHPVVTTFQLYTTVGLNTTTRNLRYFIFPAVVVWNPYNVTLRARDYQLVVANGQTNRETLLGQVPAQGALPAFPEYPSAPDATRGLSLHNITLNLLNGPDIPPGRAIVYTLPADFDLGATRQDLVLDLAPGWNLRSGVPTTAWYENPNENIPPAYTPTFLQYSWGSTTFTPQVFNIWGLSLKFSTGQPLQGIRVDAALFSRQQGFASGPMIGPDVLPNGISNRGWKFTLNTTSRGDTYPAVRWLANYNPRAAYINRSPVDAQQPLGDGGLNNQSGSFSRFVPPATTTPALIPAAGVGYPATRTGYALDISGNDSAPLFALPTLGDDLAARTLSVGVFQHAYLYRHDPGMALANLIGPGTSDNLRQWSASSYSPAYPFGNSLANPRIAPDRVFRTYAQSASQIYTVPTYDHSYLLNRAVWDGYFLSSVSHASEPVFPLPNSRLIPYTNATGAAPATADLRAFERASSRLLLDGGFNVNSTSIEAWTAVLASLRNVDVESHTASDRTRYPRAGRPIADPFGDTADTAEDDAAYNGFRELTDAQLRSLATKLVAEIRTRGPFLSLGQFVNRSLLLDDIRGLKGALQAAIDATDINAPLRQPTPATLPATVPTGAGGGYTTVTNGAFNTTTNPPYYVNRGGDVGSKQLGFGDTGTATAAAAPDADSAGGDTAAHSAPGFLTQADLLTILGPVLSARSDTFLVRVYAESVSPLDPAVITARSWCEAVIQRTPDYVDSAANDAEELPASGALATENATLGRAFKVVSFRWLGPDDI